MQESWGVGWAELSHRRWISSRRGGTLGPAYAWVCTYDVPHYLHSPSPSLSKRSCHLDELKDRLLAVLGTEEGGDVEDG
jgi:hypothetical protein